MTDLSSRRANLSVSKRKLLEERMRGISKVRSNRDVIRPRNNQASIPLSFAQQRLWFLNQLMPNNLFYNLSSAVKLEGRLDLKALERAINEIVRRHEVLRTRLEVEAGVPVQVVDEWRPRSLEVEGLASLTPEEREKEVRRIAKKEAGTEFDLTRGPLLRVKILKLEEERHVTLFTMHHIVSDAWSMGVLVREICVLYEAISEGKESPLPELKIQYADYAVWQREWLQGEVLERQIDYWKRQLKGAPAVLELPADRPRPPAQSFRGGRQTFDISFELTARLKNLSYHEDVTLFMTLLAGFQALLYRYTWQDDILVGASNANRNRNETERLIGFFVNMLVLRTDLSGNPTFIELLARVREVALGAYAHQDVPFDMLVDELQPERSLSHTPLFQVVFVLQNAHVPTPELRGLRLVPLNIENEMMHFDLVLSMEETSQGLIGILEYSADLFEASTITMMLNNYAALLEAMAAYPEQRVLDTPLHLEGGAYAAPNPNPQNNPVEVMLETETFLFE